MQAPATVTRIRSMPGECSPAAFTVSYSYIRFDVASASLHALNVCRQKCFRPHDVFQSRYAVLKEKARNGCTKRTRAQHETASGSPKAWRGQHFKKLWLHLCQEALAAFFSRRVFIVLRADCAPFKMHLHCVLCMCQHHAGLQSSCNAQIGM